MRVRASLAGLLLMAVGVPALAADVPVPPAAFASTAGLTPHRALYTMTLDPEATGKKGGDITAAHGSMGFEVVDTCDGWAVRQRLRMTITDSDGQDVEMVTDYSTWESRDGLRFRFTTNQTTGGTAASVTDGSATIERPGSAVTRTHSGIPACVQAARTEAAHSAMGGATSPFT